MRGGDHDSICDSCKLPSTGLQLSVMTVGVQVEDFFDIFSGAGERLLVDFDFDSDVFCSVHVVGWVGDRSSGFRN